MPLRIGIIGAGDNTRRRHIPGLLAQPDVQIVNVVNRSPESSQRVASAFGIPRVAASVEELVADPEVDAVCIGTWPYRHREYTIRALEAGKHVLCEARMAMDLDEAEEMLAASERYPHLVAQLVPAPFDFRVGPTVTRLVREGALGALTGVTVVVANGSGLDPDAPIHWRHRMEFSGRNMMQFGIYVELLQRWLGDIDEVRADAHITVAGRLDPERGVKVAVDVPDSLSVLARLAGGVPLTGHFSTVEAGAPWQGITLFGTRATLRWAIDDTAAIAGHGQPFAPLEPDPGTDRGWQVEADFVSSIRTGTPVRLTSFSDGVRYMRVTDACWRSWQEGRAVTTAP